MIQPALMAWKAKELLSICFKVKAESSWTPIDASKSQAQDENVSCLCAKTASPLVIQDTRTERQQWFPVKAAMVWRRGMVRMYLRNIKGCMGQWTLLQPHSQMSISIVC